MKSRNLLLAVLLLATVTLGSVSADSRTKFDPAAFHESLRQPARLLNQIVYVPESRVHLAKRDGDQVIRGSAIDSTDGNSMDDEDNGHLLYKRDAQLIDLDAPTSARRVIRALAGCPAATTIDVQPRTIEPHTPLSVNFANLEATGIDFGQGPEYWAHWNATLLEINGDATTTLTEVNHQTITTKGAFDGCFETTRITNVLTATNTNPGKTATFTPNLANRYFVDVTAAPGAYKTRIPIRITTTTYTFPTSTSTATTNLGGLFQTIGAPRMRPRRCPSIPRMANGARVPATFTDIKRGATLTATISHVTESIYDVDMTRGTTRITWQAVYSAGALETVSYTLTTRNDGKQVTDTRHPFTKTISRGRLVTRRRIVTTPINDARDGCLDRIVDRSNWVLPDDLEDGVYNAVGSVGSLGFHGLVLMEHAHTRFAHPYPNGVPPKPTSITPTGWMCSSFYAAVHPSTARGGETVTVQLYNLPATPVKLLSKGWSTVYEARYAATLLSNAIPVTTVPSTATRTTVGTPTCISASFKMVITSTPGIPSMTAAPHPTPVYEIQGSARNYSDKPDVPNPPKWREVIESTDFWVNAGGGVRENYPALVGPVTVKTRITYDKKAKGAELYSLATSLVGDRRRALVGRRDEGSEAEDPEDDDVIFGGDGDADDTSSSTRLHARTGQSTLTSLRIKLGGFNKVAFVARDPSQSDLFINLYEPDFRNLKSASDWRIEWIAALPLSGNRVLAPFTVHSSYFIPRSKWSGSSSNSVQPNTHSELNLVLRTKAVVTPWWKASGRGTPTIRFNVSAPMIWNPVNFTFTPAHPDARKSAFTSYVFSALKTGRVNPVDYDSGAAGKAIWTIETNKRGSYKIPRLPVIFTRNYGAVDELKARYASDAGGSGRLGAKPGEEDGPSEEELERDLKEFKDLDGKK